MIPALAAPLPPAAPSPLNRANGLTAAQARAAQMTPDQRDKAIARIGDTAKSFESSFLSVMMGSMFNGVDMGGGQGGEMFKSVLMDAVAKKVVAGGGIGLAQSVRDEMLKMQGLN